MALHGRVHPLTETSHITLLSLSLSQLSSDRLPLISNAGAEQSSFCTDILTKHGIGDLNSLPAELRKFFLFMFNLYKSCFPFISLTIIIAEIFLN